MGIFQRMRNGAAQFMYGRNGMDQLNRALFYAYLGLWLVELAVNAALKNRADREHRYFTCKNCKTICRVPIGKGRIVITCPKCGAQIQAKT